jgi:hypothetical protein
MGIDFPYEVSAVPSISLTFVAQLSLDIFRILGVHLKGELVVCYQHLDLEVIAIVVNA